LLLNSALLPEVRPATAVRKAIDNKLRDSIPWTSGLVLLCELDPNVYPSGVKIPDYEFKALNINRHDFHGDSNYTISPSSRSLER
jgi:Rhodopirellula transposase DDE domain